MNTAKRWSPGMLAYRIVGRLFGAHRRHRMFRWLRMPRAWARTVSVVVPIYNVERYLEACLQSIAEQTYRNLEVLLIDDGSTDSSRSIAEEFAVRDPRFTVISQTNAGLGAARNTGIRAATGFFLTFVDSDDVLVGDAYSRMVGMITQSGSDFVVGGIERLAGESRWKDDWVHRVHGQDRMGISIEDLPEVTKNVSAWSKLYRTDFFRTVIGEYPVNLLNEDQEPAAKGYAFSTQFDVLAATTYYWRVREDGSSITQSRLRLKNLEDRITAERGVAAAYRAGATPAMQLYRWRDFVGADFAQFYRVAAEGDEHYWRRMVEFLRELFDVLDPEVWEGVEARERCLAYLISTGDRSAARKMVAEQAEHPEGVPVQRTGAEVTIDVERWGFSGVDWPPELLRIREVDTPIRTGITRTAWSDSGELIIHGFCYTQHGGGSSERLPMSAYLVHPSGSLHPLELTQFNFRGEDAELPGTSYEPYPRTGFTLRVAPALIEAQSGDKALSTCLFEIHYAGQRVTLLPQDAEHIPELRPHITEQGLLLRLQADRLNGLQLSAVPQKLTIRRLQISADRAIDMTIAVHRTVNSPFSIALFREGDTTAESVIARFAQLREGEDVEIQFVLPRAHASGSRFDTRTWRLAVTNDAVHMPLGYPPHIAVLEAPAGVCVDWDAASGALLLLDTPWTAQVHRAYSTGGRVVVEGAFAERETDAAQLVFLAPNGTMRQPVEWEYERHEGTFMAVFEFASDEFRVDSNGLTPIFGLCVIRANTDDPFALARSAFFADRGSNGLREIVAAADGSYELTDFGFRRSLLIRGATPADRAR